MLSEYGLDDSLDLVAIYHIIINTVPTRLKHFRFIPAFLLHCDSLHQGAHHRISSTFQNMTLAPNQPHDCCLYLKVEEK